MSELLKNRHEILFLYDVKDANPNDDPVDENKPRIDEETGVNIVTDVRLKRTIRDYLCDYKGLTVFVKEVRKDSGDLETKEERLDELKINSPDDLLNKCIDIRLFGATAAIKNKTITFTGPVQFRFGRSLHPVKIEYVKGTTVMPSKESKKQGTFTECYIVPYSLIVFYGIANENLAKISKMTEEDHMLLLEAMWNGTKNLISRSKVGHMPRLLIDIEFKENNYHIGDLDKLVKINSDYDYEEIRDISDLSLNVGNLLDVIKNNSTKIHRIRVSFDKRLNVVPRDSWANLSSYTGIDNIEFLAFD